jgi:prolyl-tRNA synthetase
MKLRRGIEVGNIFKLGTRYSEAMGANFLDQDGESKPVIMGSYGIGSGRLLASIAEAYNDEYGLVWPITVAPFAVHLVLLPGKTNSDNTGKDNNLDARTQAENLYGHLQNAGIDVLFDDRDLRPGVKFNDADLIGNPIRLTVSERSLQSGGIEVKLRDQVDKNIVPVEDAIPHVRSVIDELLNEIKKSVVSVPFEL